MTDTEPAPAHTAPGSAQNTASNMRAASPTDEPHGIVVTVYDVPIDSPFERVVSAIDAVRRLGPGKVIVDQGGVGVSLTRELWQRGISVQALEKPILTEEVGRRRELRLANCRALLGRVEQGLRDGRMTDEAFRANLLFDIEALSERC